MQSNYLKVFEVRVGDNGRAQTCNEQFHFFDGSDPEQAVEAAEWASGMLVRASKAKRRTHVSIFKRPEAESEHFDGIRVIGETDEPPVNLWP